MAANKFANMLHRNTNKLTLILVYAILEWVLIILLLLNSLFSYVIIKFADYFGLKRPCLWCSRLDHIFEPGKSKNFHRDLICEAHATEISKLGFCLNHRKLAESRDMCEDCSSSSQMDGQEWSKKFAFFPWMKQIGMISGGDDEHVVENGEENLSCSCCGVSLGNKLYPPCILIKPSWGVLDYAQKDNLIEQEGFDAHTDEGDHSDQSRSEFVADHQEDELAIEENKGKEEELEENGSGSVSNFFCREFDAEEDEKLDLIMEIEQEKEEEEPIKEESLHVSMDDQPCEQKIEQVSSSKDSTSEIPAQHLEFFIGQEDCTLIPVEIMASNTKVEEKGSSGNLDVILDFDMPVQTQVQQVTETWHSSGETLELLSRNLSSEKTKLSEVELIDFSEDESSFVFHAEAGHYAAREFQQVAIAQATQTPLNYDTDDEIGRAIAAMERGEIELEVHQAFEDDIHMQSDEFDAEVSIGTEIPDHEPIDEIQSQGIQPSYPCEQECPSTSSADLHTEENHYYEKAEGELVEFKSLSVETSQKDFSNHSAFCLELNETEEEKVPDTPTSIDSLHLLHKKLLVVERRESGTEDSLDGSVFSDIDAGEGVFSVEKLKSTLRSERKALNAVYAELEEERSASAEAASQTMAMINRLQEEKAAMQMEALQYQRMMEEQSEYDQEALQLLNELMVKREKENQELEKEVEVYRKRIQEYEAKERIMLRRLKESSTRSRNSSGSFSNAEDSDGLSIDLNTEVKEEACVDGHEEVSNQNTPVDAVLYLEESLAGFEEERLSILDQLRVLEDKLFTLDTEDEHFEDIKSIEHLYSENGNGYHHEHLDVNGVPNGHSKEMNGKHHQEKRIMGSKAKRLLPLFDATEAEDGVLNENGEEFDYVTMKNSVMEFEQDNNKLAIEEEVDHVYQRLQALEADREFLKHCINSLSKGDKGLYLLQEILQHLRDLRSVENRVRNMGD
ncbi:hypothetical protein UlMin_042790 [Ulmus minor]